MNEPRAVKARITIRAVLARVGSPGLHTQHEPLSYSKSKETTQELPLFCSGHDEGTYIWMH